MPTTKPKNAVNANYPSSVPKNVSELLGKPPLLADEDPKRYSLLFDQYVSILGPRDAIEWLWLKEAVDLRWDILRLGGFAPAIIDGEKPFIFAKLLLGAGVHKSQINYYLDCYSESGKAKEQADAIFESRGWSIETVSALAFAERIQTHDSLEKMMAGKGRRHDQLLHLIEQRRTAREQTNSSRHNELEPNPAPLVPAGPGA